jgi:threonine dehydrogenase-like Zn-dependent dehydrogenase
MRSIAVRLYGENDLRLEEFELPAMAEDEILADVTTNSICMSDHKATLQGARHKRVPKDIASAPIIIGHEFCGTILAVGARWQDRFQPGQKYSIQPALNVPGRELEAPGYSFRTIGGQATRVLIPREVMERDCLLPYEGDDFFGASLAEPVSCVIGAFNSSYHFTQGEYTHRMGIRAGGALVVLAGAGPMGLAAVDYALHGPRQPRLLVITDVDAERLARAAQLFPPASAAGRGVELRYFNTSAGDAVARLRALADGGYDDAMVFAPVPALIEQASRILAFNGCLNFFAGPAKADFFATVNFYDIHYMGHHVVGSSGGNTDDLREALDLMGRRSLNPAVMVTHIGGLDCVPATIRELPKIPGGKKLIYTQASLPLTALADFATLGETDPLFAELARLTQAHNGLWSREAEQYLLAHAAPIERVLRG